MDRRFRLAAAAAFVVAMTAGCATPEPAGESRDASGPDTAAGTAANPLAGTAWSLFEIQSMDDSQGTTRIDDPSRYVMRLNADGTANLRLNCNTANGPWSVRPSADPDNGNFSLGPLAMTRALCPPPSYDERLAADARYMTGYILRDGRLYISLMADGGIYGWEPYSPGIAYVAQSDPALEAAIRRASPDYTREIVGIDGRSARYVHGRIDLNGDGRDEVFAYLLGPYFCGTGGCNLLLFREVPGGYALAGNFPTTRPPVIVADESHAGWRSFWRLESGGGMPATYVRERFDGTRYVEAERVPADRRPDGTAVLTGTPSYEQAVPLAPGR